jgi:adenosine deaminase
VVYAEVFFDPQAHTSRGIAFETVLTGIRKAQEEASERLGLRTQLIMCFLRDMSVESALETLEASLLHKEAIVGVGLDSDEASVSPPTAMLTRTTA